MTTTNHSSFDLIHDWKFLDFEYPSFTLRRLAIKRKTLIPENNLPLGVDFFSTKIFITTPRWKDGVPFSLGYTDYPPKEKSPLIKPYPNWNFHTQPYDPDCFKLMSVYRTFVDECARLWSIDSGIVNATVNRKQICPPKIMVFSLESDDFLFTYNIPSNQVKKNSFLTNIVVDVSRETCRDAFAYVADVWGHAIIVYSLRKHRSWRVENEKFLPDPKAATFNLYGLKFEWLDGVFGMATAPSNFRGRKLYFHPMASFKEFSVFTEALQNEVIWKSQTNTTQYFMEEGDRGFKSQSSTSGISKNGVMFFTQVHLDNIGCWNVKKKYSTENIALLLNKDDESTNLIQFPNDLKLDKESNQGIWIMSNRLPIFLYKELNFNEVNFRILHAKIDNIIRHTPCGV